VTKSIADPTKKIAFLGFCAVVRWHRSSFHRSANHVCAHLQLAEGASALIFAASRE